MELPENLDLSDTDDIHNDPIHVILTDKKGERVYSAKMSPAQIAFLNYRVGDKVLLSTIGLPIVIDFYIIKSRNILVKRDTRYEIHLHFEVDTSAPIPPPF